MRKTLVAAFAALAAFAAAASASAASWKECLGERLRFDSLPVALQGSSTSFPAGYWANGINDTVNRFNQNPSNFRYSLSVNSGGVGRGNGQSEIWASDSADQHQGAPAIAYQYWTCYWLFGNHVHMNEVDVIYNASTAWTADRTQNSLIRYNGSGRALQSTGIHELGHGGPLNHVNSEYNVMGSDFEHMHANGSTVNAYVGEDTSDGLVLLYGARSWNDVAVTHWKYSGASGEYSDHTRTVMRTSGGGGLATRTIDGETGYRVNRGQSVQVEFTYENNGSSTRNGLVTGYYVSTNNLITTLDRRIGGATWNLARDNVLTTSVTVTIPNDLTSNRAYWVGVVIDENNAVSESVESNNATYIPIWVN